MTNAPDFNAQRLDALIRMMRSLLKDYPLRMLLPCSVSPISIKEPRRG